MTVDRETLMAFADGELNEIEARRVAKAVESDPSLAAEVEAHRRLKVTLAGHFRPIMDAPVPERLTAMLTDRTVVDFEVARQRRETRRWLPGWGVGGAVAAALVIGLGIGTQVPGGGPVASKGGTLIASGKLAHALDTQLASTQGDVPIRVLVSFRDASGTACRGFDGGGLSGIACHDGGQWALRETLSGRAAHAGDYRQATSPAIMAAAQDMAAGEPFDADAERRERDAGWMSRK